jgi:4-hydroxythreonine-4-phosphate dehydrogenase
MTHTHNRPVIGITMGDPAGIGPEILINALIDPEITSICRPVVIGDMAVLKKACRFLNNPVELFSINHPREFSDRPDRINLIAKSNLDPGVTDLGAPTPETGKAMENYILTGVELAVENDVSALVTAPITKTGLKEAGSRFHGHTELIAHKTDTEEFAMMLAGESLKVVLVTIHMPLARVPANLTPEAIVRIIRLTHTALVSRFGIENPRLAVAGLNPHAGEDAMFGHEEDSIITPAVETARAKGYTVEGPLPPDTVFYNATNGKFDAVVCMYHDQGLIPFKMVHFKDGVNTTIGLPIIRTSVDHGTAYDIAWKGKADATSMKEAIKMAVLQANNNREDTNGQ